MRPEIHLLTCLYEARCTDRECTDRAVVLARWTDDQGLTIMQRELCVRHAQWLKDYMTGIRDLRESRG